MRYRTAIAALPVSHAYSHDPPVRPGLRSPLPTLHHEPAHPSSPPPISISPPSSSMPKWSILHNELQKLDFPSRSRSDGNEQLIAQSSIPSAFHLQQVHSSLFHRTISPKLQAPRRSQQAPSIPWHLPAEPITIRIFTHQAAPACITPTSQRHLAVRPSQRPPSPHSHDKPTPTRARRNRPPHPSRIQQPMCYD
ncbi:hypothetical protein ACLOJK_003769 [Asimina triloba]